MKEERINRRFAGIRHRLSWTGGNLVCHLPAQHRDGLEDDEILGAISDLAEAGYTKSARAERTSSGELRVRWDNVGKVTYSWEWPAEGWRAAARVSLGALETLKAKNLTLDAFDSSDVFMAGSTAMVANLGLIARWSAEREAACLKRIERHFIRPLAVASQGQARLVRKLLRSSPDGISSSEARHCVRLHEGSCDCAENKRPLELADAISRVDEMPRLNRDEFWKRYKERARPAEIAAKTAIIANVLSRETPATVLDIGCNTGRYALQAGATGASVVALDNDEACMDSLFAQSSSSGSAIQSVVMNLADPSGSRGWGEGWCTPAERRFSSELVVALAIVHHLVFGMRLPDMELRQLFKALAQRWLLLEFVPVKNWDHPYAQSWRAPSYSIDWVRGVLSDQFVERERWEYGERGRTLLLFERAHHAIQ